MKSLNSYLLVASVFLFSGVVAFGAIAVMSVGSVSKKARLVETEAQNIAFVGSLQNQALQLLVAKHHHLLEPEAHSAERAASILNRLQAGISSYIAYEEAADYPESVEEVRLLRELDTVVRHLPEITSPPANARLEAQSPHVLAHELLREGERINELLAQINDLHFAIIARKMEAIDRHFGWFLALVLALSLVGFALVCASYMINSRYIVSPLTALSRTARQLADGDLSARADTQSRTEIGALCRSFNDMADTIQRHEHDLSELTHDLERRVKARTRSLERAYAALQRTQKDLVRMERLATLGQIATTVNHEIKTPLNALYINLQLLKRRTLTGLPGESADRSEIAHLISMIDREVLRISSYLDEFVKYARFPASHPRRADANRIVTQVVDMFRQKAKESGVRIETGLDSRLPPFLLDERRISQALINLIVNALDAMPEGGTLSICTREADSCGLIDVSDTGAGIDPEDQERIFQPFVSGKATSLGFGLAIVQRIAEDHGGSLACVSHPGTGTTFTLRLPIAGTEAQSAPAVHSLRPALLCNSQ